MKTRRMGKHGKERENNTQYWRVKHSSYSKSKVSNLDKQGKKKGKSTKKQGRKRKHFVGGSERKKEVVVVVYLTNARQ